jgi:two-component system CheB/CheR fusion protein
MDVDTPQSVSDPSGAFPVVGIGGSAGSLEPLRALLRALPAEPGLALVIVTHHPPDQHSVLPDILAEATGLPVTQAEAGQPLEPDHVYVALPDRSWVLRDGALVPREPEAAEEGGPPHPVDVFFRSLAAEEGERAVGIVLSGTGTDGTLGVKAIKSQGGMVMVQDPDSAEFDGMPDSALGTGLVDYAQPPADIPPTLLAYLGARDQHRAPSAEPVPAVPEGVLRGILAEVSGRTGQDFSGYKRSTLVRRLEWRMHVHQISEAAQYLRYLRDNPAEADLLFKEVIISVTNFFRDPEAWQALAREVLPERLRAAADEGRPFRAWVVGCATGEEAYTLAILVCECLEELGGAGPEVQLFATDVDQEAIETARVGRYPAGITEDLSARRLARFFVAEEDSYRVSKELRDRVVFAEHNVLQSPPFTRLDLVSCRNLLIYLERDLQQRLLPLFRYALRPRGVLFLGTSETPEELTNQFRAEDREWRLYRVDPEAEPAPLPARLGTPGHYGLGPREEAPATTASGEPAEGMTRVVERLLAEQFAPPCVVVNDRGEAVFVHGRTGQFLEPAAGPARSTLLDMARPGLRAPLSQALREVGGGEAERAERTAHVQTNGDTREVQVAVQRLRSPRTLRGMRLVSFRSAPAPEPPGETPEQASATAPTQASAPGEEPDAASEVARLERELAATRQDKQVTVEELQSSNEELQSMNEELQSMNEELQSSNEELEVSKEEVESLNEELRSVNAELEARVSELAETQDDMKNLLESTHIATLFLDEDLQIKRFTEAARELVALRDSDIGRPVGELSTNLRYGELTRDASEVLRTLVPKDVEVQTQAGHWYLLRIMPYRTADNVIRGLVCTFQDIQHTKHLQHSEAYFRAIVDTVREPLLVLDGDLRVVSANDGFYRTFPLAPGDVQGRPLFELGEGQWSHPELHSLLRQVLPERRSFRDCELEVRFPGRGPQRLALNGRILAPGDAGSDAGEEGEEMILLAMDVLDGHNDSGGARIER